MKNARPQWNNHIIDECLAKKEFLDLWLRFFPYENRLDRTAAAMGWHRPSESAEHPHTYFTDMQVVAINALQEGLYRQVLIHLAAGAFDTESQTTLLTQLFKYKHQTDMLAHETYFGNFELSEELFELVSTQEEELQKTLVVSGLKAEELELLEGFLFDIDSICMRALSLIEDEDELDGEDDEFLDDDRDSEDAN